MPWTTPTAAQVGERFREALRPTHEFDPDEYHRLERGMTNPAWCYAAANVAYKDAADGSGKRLVFVDWEFAVDSIDTASELTLRTSARDLAARLAGFVGPAPAAYDAVSVAENRDGPTLTVRCKVRGVVG